MSTATAHTRVSVRLDVDTIRQRAIQLNLRFQPVCKDSSLAANIQRELNEFDAVADHLRGLSSDQLTVTINAMIDAIPDVCDAGKAIIRRGLLGADGPNEISTPEMRKVGQPK